MKKLKPLFLLMVFALTSISLKAQEQNKPTQTVQIKTSAVCNMCKKTLEKRLASEKGVKSSSLDVDSKVLTVVFDSRKADADSIRKAVTESGYDADQLPADENAYNRLHACCKKGNGNR